MPVKLIRVDGGRPVELGRFKTRAEAITTASLLVGRGGRWSTDETTITGPDGARYKIATKDTEMISLQPTFKHTNSGNWYEEASYRDSIVQARVIPVGRYMKLYPEFGDLKMVGISLDGTNKGRWVFGGKVSFRSELDYTDGAMNGSVVVPPAETKFLIAGGYMRQAWVLECEDLAEMEAWFNDNARPVTQLDKRPTTRW